MIFWVSYRMKNRHDKKVALNIFEIIKHFKRNSFEKQAMNKFIK